MQNRRELRRRVQDAFVSIYSTNMGIIHGATLYTFVYRALTAVVYGDSSSKFDDSYFFESNYLGLVFCCLTVLAIMSWVATEYYWFMSLVPRTPAFVDTIVHFFQGMFQLGCAFLVTSPHFF